MSKQKLRIAILANGERGLKVIKELIAKEYEIKAVVHPPNKKNFFINNNFKFEIFSENNINSPDFIEKIKVLNLDVIIVAGFSTILKDQIISLPNLATINLHAGPLPNYRGGSPLNWQLINGEDYAGLSVISIDSRIDAGNILTEVKFKISENDNIEDLHGKANNLFPKLTIDALYKIKRGEKGSKQNEKNAIYWHQRTDEDGFLSFRNMHSQKIKNIVRALHPSYPAAWGMCEGEKIRIKKCSFPKQKIKGTLGKVLFIQGKGPYIICKDQAILVEDYNSDSAKDFKMKHGMLFL